jgi:hypothetical protein
LVNLINPDGFSALLELVRQCAPAARPDRVEPHWVWALAPRSQWQGTQLRLRLYRAMSPERSATVDVRREQGETGAAYIEEVRQGGQLCLEARYTPPDPAHPFISPPLETFAAGSERLLELPAEVRACSVEQRSRVWLALAIESGRPSFEASVISILARSPGTELPPHSAIARANLVCTDVLQVDVTSDGRPVLDGTAYLGCGLRLAVPDAPSEVDLGPAVSRQ